MEQTWIWSLAAMWLEHQPNPKPDVKYSTLESTEREKLLCQNLYNLNRLIIK